MNVGRGSAVALSLLGLGALAGCAGEITPPVVPIMEVTQRSSSVAAGNPELTPNSVRYREPAYAHATGRSGLATLSARALLSQDGSTALEIASGELDGAPPVDPITKLQVKLFDPLDSLVRVENHNGVRLPAVALVLQDAVRHSTLQIQGNVEVANVTGKQNRTGVVTIRERVNRRPDIAASAVTGPARAVVNTSVTFVGTIAELNGDLGARANCVFYIQGVEAARTNGIWVAEGDAVNCTMTHTFSTVGAYSVTMAAESVVPGDWDETNNATSMSVEIYQPVQFLHGTATAYQREEWYEYDYEYSSYGWFGDSYFRDNMTRNERHETSASFYGYSPNALSFPAVLAVRQSSGGVEHHSLNANGPATGTCLNASSGHTTASLCSDGVATWLNVSRYSATIVYYTYNYDWGRSCGFWGGGCYQWGPSVTYYYSTVIPSGGGFQTINDYYRFEVNAAGATGEVFKADVTTSLSPFNGQSGWATMQCNSGFNYTVCTRDYRWWTGKQGTQGF